MKFDKQGKQTLLLMILVCWLIQLEKQKFNKTL